MIEPINRLLETVNFDAVFYSLDWHPSDHVSFIDNLPQRAVHPSSPVSYRICLLYQLTMYSKEVNSMVYGVLGVYLFEY